MINEGKLLGPFTSLLKFFHKDTFQNWIYNCGNLVNLTFDDCELVLQISHPPPAVL